MYRKKAIKSWAAAATLTLALSACANQAGPTTSETSGTSGKVNIPAISKVDVPPGAVLPKGDGKATCAATTTLAYAGAQTGPNAQLGINIFNGIQLAINQHNAANPGCQVQFKKFDTEGDPNKATGPVTQMVSEAEIVGVIGLPFSGESKATAISLSKRVWSTSRLRLPTRA